MYGMDLDALFIMQVPEFKAVLMNTMPNVDELSGNVAEATTFAETEAWEEKDVASIARKFAAQGANSTIVCVGQTGHRVSHLRQCEEASYASCAGTPCNYRLSFTCHWTTNIVPVAVLPSSRPSRTISNMFLSVCQDLQPGLGWLRRL